MNFNVLALSCAVSSAKERFIRVFIRVVLLREYRRYRQVLANRMVDWRLFLGWTGTAALFLLSLAPLHLSGQPSAVDAAA